MSMESGLKQAVAFLKKSSAKNFCNLYTGCCNVPRRKISKSFLVLFFKKELIASFLTSGSGLPRRFAPRNDGVLVFGRLAT
jgi:hypothetical protein